MRIRITMKHGLVVQLVIALYHFYAITESKLLSCKNSNALQCLALRNLYSLPRNYKCDPIKRQDCSINDLVDEDIASCRLEMMNDGDSDEESRLSPDARCYPDFMKYGNIYERRFVATSAGNPRCVPQIYGKKLICGQHGSRCVCDTGRPTPRFDSEHFLAHKCRCQWFANYCSISTICSNAKKCKTDDQKLTCVEGSINQCVANPTLCGNKVCVLFFSPATRSGNYIFFL